MITISNAVLLSILIQDFFFFLVCWILINFPIPGKAISRVLGRITSGREERALKIWGRKSRFKKMGVGKNIKNWLILVAGILERDQEQSVVYGSIDFGKTIVTHSKYLDLLQKAGNQLKILPHKVLYCIVLYCIFLFNILLIVKEKSTWYRTSYNFIQVLIL